jgi:GT2 family glycosyltransferase
MLLALPDPPDAILIADQTIEHPAEVEAQLSRWSDTGAIRWLRLDQPSIPRAMNKALLTATTDLILFLDDDIEPSPELIVQHRESHSDAAVWAVVGQILQPGESASHEAPRDNDLAFEFSYSKAMDVLNVMAGNLSVKRLRAIEVGGFDENYLGVAYRFETDFAYRLRSAGGRIRFDPAATLRHLKLSSGGLRTYGDHMRSARPEHSVGDYYFALTHQKRPLVYALRRLRRNVLTRFHATHPWTLPSKLIGEIRGMALARKLHNLGPVLIRS